ncbi:MAG: hypothetical protein JOY54_12215 [Acidobacteriaceae bacterium]|nr:hypothetical protein [Acidobacteriaceae bacterium]
MKGLSDNVIGAQISLDREEYQLAKKQAAVLGISLVELIRRDAGTSACATAKPVDGVRREAGD